MLHCVTSGLLRRIVLARVFDERSGALHEPFAQTRLVASVEVGNHAPLDSVDDSPGAGSDTPPAVGRVNIEHPAVADARLAHDPALSLERDQDLVRGLLGERRRGYNGNVEVSAKSRAERFLGRTMRMPSVLDRRGARWVLQALSPATVIVLVHRGRKSGRQYKTPVEVLHHDRERDELIVSPMFGRNSDWYRNVVAGGLIEVHVRGEERQVEWRELNEGQRRAAIDAYREAHPFYSRMILRMLTRLNRFEGDAEQALLRELPMLGLRRAHAAPDQSVG